jgi:plasmid stabilization system protein ParE
LTNEAGCRVAAQGHLAPLIVYSPRAIRQIDALILHYEERQRMEAVRAFRAALDQAERKIESNPAAGLAAPRPYPRLARPGRPGLG